MTDIRPLREEEIPEVVRLAHDIWHLHYPSLITVEQIEYMLRQRYSPEVIRGQLLSGKAWWDTLRVDGGIVAFSSCESGKDPGAMKLDKLYVRYDLRGRGYGSRLIRHAEGRARALGYSRLYLQVNRGNRSAIGAYLKNGFAVDKSAEFDIGGGFLMCDFVMSKTLTSGPAAK